jgi:hypothetical protein
MANDFYFRALLPILWAAISTVIALLLYRTSSAFFEQEAKAADGTRRIRLVGSVVIAAVVFVGLWRVTPAAVLTGAGRDQVAFGAQELRDLQATTGVMGDAVTRLEACDATQAVGGDCAEALHVVRTSLDAVQAKLAGLAPPAAAKAGK